MSEENDFHKLIKEIKLEMISQGLFEGKNHIEIEEIWQRVNPGIIRAISRFLNEESNKNCE